MVNNPQDNFNLSLPERIASYILEEMFKGNLKQGDRLVESKIAKELNVSQAPVREALYILEKRNVVERFPRKGVRVRVIDDKEIKDYIEALTGIIRLSGELTSDWSEEKFQELQKIYDAAQRELEEGHIENYVQNAASFFSAFVSWTNNSVLQHFTSEILFVTNVFANTNWNQALIERFHAQLTAGFESLKEKDFKRACELFTETIWITVEN